MLQGGYYYVNMREGYINETNKPYIQTLLEVWFNDTVDASEICDILMEREKDFDELRAKYAYCFDDVYSYWIGNDADDAKYTAEARAINAEYKLTKHYPDRDETWTYGKADGEPKSGKG